MSFDVSPIRPNNVVLPILKGGYHQCVSNVKYAVVSLTTLQREQCFAISECFVTSPLVTSRISREGKDVTIYRNVPTSS